MSFSPCVYPVLPMTASFVAGFNVHGTKLMGLVVSLVYVLGLLLYVAVLEAYYALSSSVKINFNFQKSKILRFLRINYHGST